MKRIRKTRKMLHCPFWNDETQYGGVIIHGISCIKSCSCENSGSSFIFYLKATVIPSRIEKVCGIFYAAHFGGVEKELVDASSDIHAQLRFITSFCPGVGTDGDADATGLGLSASCYAAPKTLGYLGFFLLPRISPFAPWLSDWLVRPLVGISVAFFACS